MTLFCMTCESGTVVLVSGRDGAEAENAWDYLVERGDAEPRIPNTTSRATREDVRSCVASGHDYR